MRFLLPMLLLLAGILRSPAAPSVVVYGATPAGVAAALSAGRDGETVLLIEPTARIGGLLTHGLSHTDYHAYEGLTGIFLETTKRVEAYYRNQYGPDSEQVKTSQHGTQAEPKVNLMILEQMLAEHHNIQVQRQWVLVSVKVANEGKLRRVQSAVFQDAQGIRHTVEAGVFIDASYEGDLMAAARVKYRVGREGKMEYGESQAPEKSDGQLQAYNFRLCMTQSRTNLVPLPMPTGYQRTDYLDIIPLLESKQIEKVFGYPAKCVVKAQLPPLPNGKYDINDVSRSIVRLSLPGENLGWPEGDAAARQKIFDRHLQWELGLLYFLQHDEAVPASHREPAATWGLCRDEFAETAHLPPQIYVREARRMVGQYIFKEQETDYAPDDARALLQPNAIAMGEYGPNCHGTSHTGQRIGGMHTGEFYKSVAPYQIPYGVLVPQDVSNLLVPGAVSSSHVGYCALRLELIWTSLGEAAGHAAHYAMQNKSSVQDVDAAKIRRRLHQTGAATIYVSDVLPGHPDFELVQWWGSLGGLHGLAPTPAKPGQRGKNISGQYYETYPGHTVDLDRVLDASLATRWTQLAKACTISTTNLPQPDGKLTRGAWLRALHPR